MEKIVLGLLDDRTNKIEPLRDRPCLGDLLGGPLAGTPIQGPPMIDHIVHGSHCLLNWGSSIGAMAVEDVDIVHVQSRERGLGALYDVLPRETLVVGSSSAPEDLSGDDDVRPLPPKLADRLPHDLLRSAIEEDLGVVEEVHAVVAAALEERSRLLEAHLVAEAHPSAVGEEAYLEARSTQVFVLHFRVQMRFSALVFFLAHHLFVVLLMLLFCFGEGGMYKN
eukprot:TRINITY_DN16945_c1_g1_i1.p2 TRINITY_DN16945_c1_g1~~TRINITY_DN16945_c1_g1_i1.p2  ORF type:complete len:223 (-),score=21.59 TRINITY_DN16945_c1_g1_i1:164-832(-)